MTEELKALTDVPEALEARKKKAAPKAKANLTDRLLKSLRPAGKPYEIMDSIVGGLGIRVMPSGAKSFIVRRRFGSKNPTRRALGRYGDLSVAEAREKTRQWNALVKKGVDPSVEEERRRMEALEAERKGRANTFGSAFESYLKHKAKLKSVRTIDRELHRECGAWMARPLANISPLDVKQLVQAIADSGRETQAHAIFSLLRAFLNWAADSGDFGIELSPCARLKPAVLIDPKAVRSRVLKDVEIAAYWRASEGMGYPFGKLFQLLLLTALRRNEAADARWPEIDSDAKLWVIPAERMKGGAAHTVPLTPDISALLEKLPRFTAGDYLFSTTGGKKPVSGFSKAKARLDALMRADLKAQGMPFEGFVLHDVRRTCRTRFSALPVEDIVREQLLAHARPGLHKVYDLHAYESEKADALKLWHAKLKAIIETKSPM